MIWGLDPFGVIVEAIEPLSLDDESLQTICDPERPNRIRFGQLARLLLSCLYLSPLILDPADEHRGSSEERRLCINISGRVCYSPLSVTCCASSI